MSTVVLFVEIIMMSLVVIMLYKLYTSYVGWKKASAFSTAVSSSDMAKRAIFNPIEDESSKYVQITKVNVKLTRSAIPTNISATNSENNKIVQADKGIVVESGTVREVKKSSAILSDYIGEFFAEYQVMDLSPYRASELEKVVSTKYVESVKDDVKEPTLSNSQSDKSHDEIIKVEPLYVVKDSVKSVPTFFAGSTQMADDIPTLNEFSDIDPDYFITVASMNSEVKMNNKVMSDRVVLAMLDEAKLVCAS